MQMNFLNAAPLIKLQMIVGFTAHVTSHFLLEEYRQRKKYAESTRKSVIEKVGSMAAGEACKAYSDLLQA